MHAIHMHGGPNMCTASHRHSHNKLHSHAEGTGGHQPQYRRAAGLSCLALSGRCMRPADPLTRAFRSHQPQSCSRTTPATRVRRTSQVLRRSERLAKRTRREWVGEHGMVAGMGRRAPVQLYDDVGARGRRRDRRPASWAHSCVIERAKRCRRLHHSWTAGRAGRPFPNRAP